MEDAGKNFAYQGGEMQHGRCSTCWSEGVLRAWHVGMLALLAQLRPQGEQTRGGSRGRAKYLTRKSRAPTAQQIHRTHKTIRGHLEV